MAHVDFTAELTINGHWFQDTNVRARRGEKGEIEFYALILPPGVQYRESRLREEQVSETHADPMARVLYAAAVATWECNTKYEAISYLTNPALGG